MSWFLNFILLHCHSTFTAIMSPLTFILFMLNNIHSLYFSFAIYTRNVNIWTNSLMSLNFFPDTFIFAWIVCFTLNRLERTLLIMTFNIFIVQYIIAPHYMISTFKLHLLKFLLDLFFYTDKLGVLTLHWTHSRLIMKLL